MHTLSGMYEFPLIVLIRETSPGSRYQYLMVYKPLTVCKLITVQYYYHTQLGSPFNKGPTYLIHTFDYMLCLINIIMNSVYSHIYLYISTYITVAKIDQFLSLNWPENIAIV